MKLSSVSPSAFVSLLLNAARRKLFDAVASSCNIKLVVREESGDDTRFIVLSQIISCDREIIRRLRMNRPPLAKDVAWRWQMYFRDHVHFLRES